MQRSTRAGVLPRRIRKRVYFPIESLLVTKILTLTPGRRRRSSGRTRTSLAVRASGPPASLTRLPNGQPRPLQRIETFAPFGASTRSSRTRVPDEVIRPASRTIGKGLINGRDFALTVPGSPTGIASEKNPTFPWASVTRRPTT